MARSIRSSTASPSWKPARREPVVAQPHARTRRSNSLRPPRRRVPDAAAGRGLSRADVHHRTETRAEKHAGRTRGHRHAAGQSKAADEPAARTDRSQSAAGLSARTRLRDPARTRHLRGRTHRGVGSGVERHQFQRHGQFRIDEFHRRRAPRRAGRGARAGQPNRPPRKRNPRNPKSRPSTSRSGSACAPCSRAPASSCWSPAG